jgi:osmotically-inducible protein OsmY
MKRQRAVTLGVVAMLAFSAGAIEGCAAQQPPASEPPRAPTTLGGAGSAVGGVVPDEAIEETTRRELARDAVTGGEHIAADAVNGILTLTGQVSTRLAKQRAVDIAHVVRGVRAIVDRTEVTALPRPDYELDFAVAGLLSRDPVTASQRIAVRTRQGIVRLSGDADSNAVRRVAESNALSIPGVLDAVNDIVVRRERRPDAQIAAEVDRIVRDDPWLDDSRIRVTAQRGVVHLAGWVGSSVERARAENNAWASSPAGVDASALRIDQFTDDGTLRATSTRVRTDGDLQQSLLDAFVRDPRVHPFAPTVEVSGGTVVLTGVAPNPHVARALDDDARTLPGARDVRDDVKTMRDVYTESDAQIREQVAAAIARDPRLGPGVQVDVLNGRVFLRGEVGTNSDRLRAISIATSPPGARDVSDGLIVTTPTAVPRTGAASMQPR